MSNRILIFLENFLPASQAFVTQQARAIRNREIAFLVSRRIPSPLEGLDRFTVHEMRASLKGQAAELLLKGPRVAWPSLLPVVADSRLIHAHFGKNGFVIAPMAIAAGRPLLITFHGYDATYVGNPRSSGGFNQVRFFRHGRADLARDSRIWAIAVSDFIRKRLLELGFHPDRVVRHYIGVDTAFFSTSPGVKRVPGRVVCVSRFVEYKGHRYLIEALEKVARAGVRIELVMIGDGPLRGEIERLARSRLPAVTVLQNQSQTAVRDMLLSAQAYVHGSVTLENGHAEAMGNLQSGGAGGGHAGRGVRFRRRRRSDRARQDRLQDGRARCRRHGRRRRASLDQRRAVERAQPQRRRLRAKGFRPAPTIGRPGDDLRPCDR